MPRAFIRVPPVPHCFYEILKDEAVDPICISSWISSVGGFSAADAASEATLQQAREDTWDAIVRITEQFLSELL